jgi:hypothetical protein
MSKRRMKLPCLPKLNKLMEDIMDSINLAEGLNGPNASMIDSFVSRFLIWIILTFPKNRMCIRQIEINKSTLFTYS